MIMIRRIGFLALLGVALAVVGCKGPAKVPTRKVDLDHTTEPGLAPHLRELKGSFGTDFTPGLVAIETYVVTGDKAATKTLDVIRPYWGRKAPAQAGRVLLQKAKASKRFQVMQAPPLIMRVGECGVQEITRPYRRPATPALAAGPVFVSGLAVGACLDRDDDQVILRRFRIALCQPWQEKPRKRGDVILPPQADCVVTSYSLDVEGGVKLEPEEWFVLGPKQLHRQAQKSASPVVARRLPTLAATEPDDDIMVVLIRGRIVKPRRVTQ